MELAAAANMSAVVRTSVNEPSARRSVISALESAASFAITHPYEVAAGFEKAASFIGALLL
jgi:hypothetical protein